MADSQVSKRNYAKWLDDFINSFSNTKKEANLEEESVKTAEINIEDLPKVVWNDETFRVLFDSETRSATILNEFGNTVTTFPGVSTIEEVDKALNSKQIIVNSSKEYDINPELEEELKKVSTYLNDVVAEEEIMTNTTPDIITPDTPQNQNFDSNQQDDLSNIENEVNQAQAALDNNWLEKISSLQDEIKSLTKKVEALVEQQYARADAMIGVSGYNFPQMEVQHFEETANETAKQIELDNQVDITTPAGRVTLRDRIKSIEENQVNDLEVPEEPQTIQEDVELEEDYELEDDIELEEDFELEDDDIESDEEIEIVPEETSDEEENEEDIKVDEVEETEDEQKEEDETEVDEEEDTPVKLSEFNQKLFKQSICPSCADNRLVKAKAINHIVGVYCKGCNSEYAVNTETEEIFGK